MLAVKIVFWVAVGLLVFAHVGYPLLVRLLGRSRPKRAEPGSKVPYVSLIIAAHDEAPVIEAKIANALKIDYPRERLDVIVASDGSTDRTAELARKAGADLVLDLPRAGKTATQNAAVEKARGEVLAFSDANSFWEPGALRRLVERFADDHVGYVCGQVRFTDAEGDNQEGLYWRYEMWVREGESRLAGITAGNGAIYAMRKGSYVSVGPSGSHDLSLPFALTKRRWRCVYEPMAIAEEKLVPTLEGEFARKRRMMRGVWDVVVGEGMLSPRGYPPLYALEILSHRVLRYGSPLLHVIALGTNIALVTQGPVYAAMLGAQLALAAGAALGAAVPVGPLRVARYYVLVTASIAAGLWDRLRLGPQASWEKAEGAR
jgi:cellulose synthase/poly-beta-1,6-N-acetylglucosamine synthase-like glycosyltransferase